MVVNSDEALCEHPQSHVPIPPLPHVNECHDGGHHHHHHFRSGPVRPRQERALRLSLLISIGMMILELGMGLISGSLLLLSDAVHMLAHVMALGVGLLALRLANRPSSGGLPFGLYRLEVLGALLNGLGLAALSIWIIIEGVERLISPVMIDGTELMFVAVLGLVVNLISALLLFRAGAEDLNTRGAWYHLLADGISSILVIIGIALYRQTGWTMVDPVLSILVALVVAKWAVGLINEAVAILLERKPDTIDLVELQDYLQREFADIRHIHDLHIWEITTHYICLSVHIVVEDRRLSETHVLRNAIASQLWHRFGIGHAVIQFECRSHSH